MIRADAPAAGTLDQLLCKGRQVQPHTGTEAYGGVIGVVIGIASVTPALVNLSGKNSLAVQHRISSRSIWIISASRIEMMKNRRGLHDGRGIVQYSDG